MVMMSDWLEPDYSPESGSSAHWNKELSFTIYTPLIKNSGHHFPAFR